MIITGPITHEQQLAAYGGTPPPCPVLETLRAPTTWDRGRQTQRSRHIRALIPEHPWHPDKTRARARLCADIVARRLLPMVLQFLEKPAAAATVAWAPPLTGPESIQATEKAVRRVLAALLFLESPEAVPSLAHTKRLLKEQKGGDMLQVVTLGHLALSALGHARYGSPLDAQMVARILGSSARITARFLPWDDIRKVIVRAPWSAG